jgi:hypothetical protein
LRVLWFILAVADDGTKQFRVYEGSINKLRFFDFVMGLRYPPKTTIVLDNVADVTPMTAKGYRPLFIHSSFHSVVLFIILPRCKDAATVEHILVAMGHGRCSILWWRSVYNQCNPPPFSLHLPTCRLIGHTTRA